MCGIPLGKRGGPRLGVFHRDSARVADFREHQAAGTNLPIKSRAADAVEFEELGNPQKSLHAVLVDRTGGVADPGFRAASYYSQECPGVSKNSWTYCPSILTD
jgi:hypothetical protein